ncbi:response regulator transcription factor [Thioclava indica]|uniref:response regulator transcription factor n=1 Tax=Thioclava indica TaxID=1353528 RepID=UPI00138DE655|nr:helix-turn-helix transcriptional regulator [Thioclava indica]
MRSKPNISKADVAVCDVQDDGKIISVDDKVRTVLCTRWKLDPWKTIHKSLHLTMVPCNQDLFSGLRAATAAVAPKPVMLRPRHTRFRPVFQINILPLTEHAARFILFIDPDFKPLGNSTRPLLTKRESEVLGLASAGKLRIAIAHHLSISTSTVDMHTSNLRKKLGAHTTSEAIANALRLGLLPR